MLKFANLTFAQKRFVVNVLETEPKFKTAGKITLKEVSAIYDTMRLARTGKGDKIGYPNWLFAKNKIDRGVYQLPLPNDTELSAYQQELNYKLNPVVKAKAKVATLAKAKTKVVKAPVVQSDDEAQQEKLAMGRLQSIIDESMEYGDEDEDFNAILRENGIEV